MKLTREERAQVVARQLLDFVNGGADEETFITTVLADHPTLQQSLCRLVYQLIVAWSEETQFDARNEATIALSRQIVRLLGVRPYLPLI